MFAGLGVVAALAITLIVLSIQGQSPTPPTTTPAVLALPTTTLPAPSSTTTAASTTLTTTAEQRLAEVEVLLGDLWFGWFDAIYRKDPDALWDVVATTRSHDAGIAAMSSLTFESQPGHGQIEIRSLELLLDRSDCVVAFYTIDATSFRGTGSTSEQVTVLWPDERYGLRLATEWSYPRDLWLMDCDNLQRELTP
jgi:hypothetical protein